MTALAIDTGTGDLLASLDEGVLTLTLNRPEARNAMSRAMIDALARQLAAAEVDPEVKCLVLTGAGKGFCAGGDVKSSGMGSGFLRSKLSPPNTQPKYPSSALAFNRPCAKASGLLVRQAIGRPAAFSAFSPSTTPG